MPTETVLFLVSAAVATCVLFTTDAFFGFSSWRMLATRQRLRHLHAYTEKREPILAAVAMAATVALALGAGMAEPRTACLAGGAVIALAAHLVLYVKSRCVMRTFDSAPVGSAEWYSRAAKLEATMMTRASLQAAAFICIVAAGITR